MLNSNVSIKHFLYFVLILICFNYIRSKSDKKLIQNGDLSCSKKTTAENVICKEDFTVGKLKANKISSSTYSTESIRLKTLETSNIIPNNKDSILQVNLI